MLAVKFDFILSIGTSWYKRKKKRVKLAIGDCVLYFCSCVCHTVYAYVAGESIIIIVYMICQKRQGDTKR